MNTAHNHISPPGRELAPKKGNRELQIPAEMARLSVVLDEHKKALGALSERINPLLRSNPPTPDSGLKCEAEEMLAPFADQLRAYRRRIERSMDQLRDLTERCEA